MTLKILTASTSVAAAETAVMSVAEVEMATDGVFCLLTVPDPELACVDGVHHCTGVLCTVHYYGSLSASCSGTVN